MCCEKAVDMPKHRLGSLRRCALRFRLLQAGPGRKLLMLPMLKQVKCRVTGRLCSGSTLSTSVHKTFPLLLLDKASSITVAGCVT